MTYDKSTIHKIQDIYLHDAEIAIITCDYDLHKIVMPLKRVKTENDYKEVVLVFEGVQYVDISMYEPWGSGVYINEIVVDDGMRIAERMVDFQANNECFCMNIILNSGDIIHIFSSKLSIQ